MRHTIENERYLISVDTRGAELVQFFDKGENIEYIWQGNPDIWKEHSPILFPVVGRLRDDSYHIGSAVFVMPKHGFAKFSNFTVVENQKDKISFLLRDSMETREIFPYHFHLLVTYALFGNRLEVTHTVCNEGIDEMYFSIGAHPGFCCDMFDYLVFEKEETSQAYRLGKDALLMDEKQRIPFEGNRLTITPHLFGHDALIFDDLCSRSILLKSHRHTRQVKVDYFDAPCMGIWAKPGAPYVCIEPWYGIDDHQQVTGELSEKPQISRLHPGETFVFPMHITVG